MPESSSLAVTPTSKSVGSDASSEPRPFPTQRFTWDDLVRIIRVERDMAKLRRCQQDQEYYDRYMGRVRAEYETVTDYILATKMDIPTQTDPVSGKQVAVPDREDDTTRDTAYQKRILKNDFPYYFELDIEHWILWKWRLGGGDGGGGGVHDDDGGGNVAISDAEIEEAKQRLRQDLGNVIDHLHWVNPPELKSIPEIDHVHILVRRRRADENAT